MTYTHFFTFSSEYTHSMLYSTYDALQTLYNIYTIDANEKSTTYNKLQAVGLN